MDRTFLASVVLIVVTVMSLAAGCGGDDSGSAETGPTAAAPEADQAADTSATPTVAVDFQATAREFVSASVSGDCGTFADIKGWTEAGNNRDISMANCRKVTDELTALGDPDAMSTREEVGDGSVSVWVTLDYSDGTQWEMLTTFRERLATGWILSTFSYGFTRRGE